MADETPQEETIQSLANILSLVAVLTGMEAAAVQRILMALGSAVADHDPREPVSTDLAGQLLAHVAKERGEEVALNLARDVHFVAKAWEPTLSQYLSDDPYRLLPYAEILYALVIHSGTILESYDAFTRFGGPDIVLTMDQLSAALLPYPIPRPGLRWEMVGFPGPPSDQALVGGDSNKLFLFKSAASGIHLRFSELARDTEDDDRTQRDGRSQPLCGLCVWSARRYALLVCPSARGSRARPRFVAAPSAGSVGQRHLLGPAHPS
ncbi:MAG: hypothetical protein GYB68_06120 [Chloroflexi bacterium]|nr:hypothetical protein [Chloroflexota bacterium]